MNQNMWGVVAGEGAELFLIRAVIIGGTFPPQYKDNNPLTEFKCTMNARV